MLEAGSQAPDFAVQDGKTIKLSDLAGSTSFCGSTQRLIRLGEPPRVAGSATESNSTTTKASRFSESVSMPQRKMPPSPRSSTSISLYFAIRTARSAWPMEPATRPTLSTQNGSAISSTAREKS